MFTNRERHDIVLRRLARLSCALVLAWASTRAAAEVQGPMVLAIDAANSRVVIDVGRSGLFGFAGHNHEVLAPAVSGRVTFDPGDWPHSAVTLQFDAAALRVTGKGDPPADIPEVQRVMLSSEVLDVKRFPTVAFRSRRVSATPRTPQTIDLVIEGDVTLHGTTRPMTVRTTATLEPDGMTARGGFVLRQTEFGMQPVTAAGGTVRVKDEVQVQFLLKARFTPYP
jgi:polyisoprenoid-binding protein YceI